MGAMVAYIRIAPSGLLYFRRPFPRELRRFIPGQPGQVRKSLGARVITAPGAMDRYQAASAEYDRLASAARKLKDRAFDRLDEPTLAYLAKLFERQLQEEAEAAVRHGRAEKERGGWQWHLDDLRQWRLDQDSEEAAQFWGRHAGHLLEAQPLRRCEAVGRAFSTQSILCGRLSVGKRVSEFCSAGCCGHVSDLFARRIVPLAIMPFARSGSRPIARTRGAGSKWVFPLGGLASTIILTSAVRNPGSSVVSCDAPMSDIWRSTSPRRFRLS